MGTNTSHCELPSPLVGLLLYPPSLTNLRIKRSLGATAQDINSAIDAASCLPKLVALELITTLHPHMTFAPLRKATQLRTLILDYAVDQRLNKRHANEVRAIPNLTCFALGLQDPEMQLLLRAPHQLQLQGVCVVGPLDDKLTGLLASLPHLTVLSVSHANAVTLLSWLPNLHTLRLFDLALQEPLPEPQQMIAGLGQLAQLTNLVIMTSPLTCAHVSALLSRMTAVRKLGLWNMPELESLAFLSSEPLASTLTSLTLKDCRHPQFTTLALRPVYFLKELTELYVKDCFSDPINEFTLAAFKPPVARMPKLSKSMIDCATPPPQAEAEPEEGGGLVVGGEQ